MPRMPTQRAQKYVGTHTYEYEEGILRLNAYTRGILKNATELTTPVEDISVDESLRTIQIFEHEYKQPEAGFIWKLRGKHLFRRRFSSTY